MMFWQYAREVKSNRQALETNRTIKLMQAEYNLYNTDNVSLKPNFSFSRITNSLLRSKINMSSVIRSVHRCILQQQCYKINLFLLVSFRLVEHNLHMSFTTPSLGLGPRFDGYFAVMSFALLSLRHQDQEFVYECQFNALSRDSYYTSLSDWLI